MSAIPGDAVEHDTAIRKRLVRTLRFLLLLAVVGAAFPSGQEGTLSWRFWLAAVLYFASNVAYHFEQADIFRVRRLSGLIFLFDAVLLAFMMVELGERSNEFFVLFAITILMAAMSRSVLGAFASTVAIGALYAMLTLYKKTGVELLSVSFMTRLALLFVLSLFIAHLASEAEQAHTVSREAAERLQRNALYDPLTSLPNRALFVDRLGLSIGHAKQRRDYVFAVLSIDLDHFTMIVNSRGHLTGDRLLVAFARILEVCGRPGDTAAYFGGGVFAILLDDMQNTGDTTRVTELIRKHLEFPFRLSGEEVFTSASIGIALSAAAYDRPEDVLRDANTAMHRAKALGKGRHEVFDKAMHARAVEVLQLETDLRQAIGRQEFRIHYQPIISLRTGRIAGFEALIRWRHPQRGLIPPAEFIPSAEETGIIVHIGRWVLIEACRQMCAWRKQDVVGAPPLTVSVNLSGKQFSQPNLVDQICEILQETGLDARQLNLEITESVLMEHAESAAAMLGRLKGLGVRVQIDDFGTGYSSLGYLHRFPIDTLKIDRSFVGQMGVEPKNLEIVRTVVMLARNLRMETVAEGVETAEQLTQLRALECDYAQGYLFSSPVESEAIDIRGHYGS